MADDFVLNSLLSVFLDDYHEIPSDLDASSLAQKDIDLHINRIHPSTPSPPLHRSTLADQQKSWIRSLNRLMPSHEKRSLILSRACSSKCLRYELHAGY